MRYIATTTGFLAALLILAGCAGRSPLSKMHGVWQDDERGVTLIFDTMSASPDLTWLEYKNGRRLKKGTINLEYLNEEDDQTVRLRTTSVCVGHIPIVCFQLFIEAKIEKTMDITFWTDTWGSGDDFRLHLIKTADSVDDNEWINEIDKERHQ